MNRTDLDRLSRDPGNWRLYFFYFCPRDPRILVPKRIRGLGWTVNMARPLAIPFVLFLLAAVYGVVELVRALHVGGDARFAIKLLLALGVIAICYRLSNPLPPYEPSGEDDRHV